MSKRHPQRPPEGPSNKKLKEKREYSGPPTAEVPVTVSAPAVPDITVKLAQWFRVHDIPNGWRRELQAILKDVL